MHKKVLLDSSADFSFSHIIVFDTAPDTNGKRHEQILELKLHKRKHARL